MTHIHYQNARFLLSVANLKQLPDDIGIEVAFVGRSNAGKSSVLNRLTQQRHLARVSHTPGRTQLLNFFSIDERHRLVDLPGYGYANVPLAIKHQWGQLIDSYLTHRTSLKGLVLVMDIRHPMREFDQQLLGWSEKADLPVHILLNKADKLTQANVRKALLDTQKQLTAYSNSVSIQAFSALKQIGTDELRKILEAWYSEVE